MTRRVMTIAKRPRMWMHRMMVCMTGRCLAIEVLKIMANATTAMTRRVPCQACGV